MNHNAIHNMTNVLIVFLFFHAGTFHGHRKKKVGINSTGTCQELVQTDYPTPTRNIRSCVKNTASAYVTIRHPQPYYVKEQQFEFNEF